MGASLSSSATATTIAAASGSDGSITVSYQY